MTQQEQQQQARNAVIVAAAAAETAQLWPRVDWASPHTAAAIKTIFGRIMHRYGQATAVLSAQFYDHLRAAHNPPTRFVATPADPVSQEWIDKTVDNAFIGNPVHEPGAEPHPRGVHITETAPGEPVSHVTVTSDLPIEQRVPDRLDVHVQRLVLQSARDTIVDNTASDPAKPLGWARVPTSDHPCAFCILMASRTWHPGRTKRRISGYVGPSLYLSKKSATQVVGRGRSGRTRGSQNVGEKYHNHCSCIAVPVFNEEPPSTFDYREMYEKAAANAGTSSDVKKVLASMRQIYNLS